VSNRGNEPHTDQRRRLQFPQFDWARQVRSHWIAILILVCHVGLAILHSVAVPIWEAYDEPHHYEYVHYVATKHRLPQPGDPEAEELWEKFQPPLYYLLAAASMNWVDVSDNLQPVVNPYFTWGASGFNHAIHPDSERFPYSGTVLAVHVVRLLSVVIGTIGVLLTYLTGLLISPRRKWIAIGALAVHAFWPQLLFVGSMVTNDVLAATMGSVVTFVLVWIVRRGAGGLQMMALGISLGLSLLSKMNTLALFPIAAVVLTTEMVRRQRDVHKRKDRGWWMWLALSSLPVVLALLVLANSSFIAIPGIWGTDPLEREVHRGTSGSRSIDPWYCLGDALGHAARSSYAVFGWGNLETPTVLHRIIALLIALAVVGLVTMLIRRQRLIAWPALLLCMTVVLLMLALLLATAVRSRTPDYAQGRYLLPAMSAFSILLSTGWVAPWPARVGKLLTSIAMVVMFAIALALPFHSIIPAYARPSLLSRDELEALGNPLEARFDDVAELLGYRTWSRRPKPGNRIGVTLYWRALTKPSENYAVRVEILGPDGKGYGSDLSYPADGNFATSLWEPGDIFEDASYIIEILDEFPAPAAGLITLALIGEDGTPLRVSPAKGLAPSEDYLLLQQMGVYSPSGASLCRDAVRTSYRLGDQIELVGYSITRLERPEESIEVTLCWRAIAETEEDYVAFVHLRDSTGELVSQHDSPPRQGYYPTFLWAPGDIVADEHYLEIAPQCLADDCEIYVGMYGLETLERLQVLDEDGDRVRFGEILLE
jgi:hypothetical protein